jgi:hypothetical protein
MLALLTPRRPSTSPIRVTRLLLDSITPDGHGALALNSRPRRRLRFTAGEHGLWIVPGGGAAPFTVGVSS